VIHLASQVRAIVYLSLVLGGLYLWHQGQMSMGRVLMYLVLVPLLEFVPHVVDGMGKGLLAAIAGIGKRDRTSK
jgi:hypothetical protein